MKAKKNIIALFLMRGISVPVSFLLVPLTLNYLNPTRYGIWLTLTSIINWVNVLDIGLGTGLRNKFAEAIAKSDDELARSYVSTSYLFIALAALLAILIFWFVNPLLSWSKILNTSPDMESELTKLAGVVFTFFCLRLIFGLIGTILIADQRPAMNSLLEVVTNVLSLIVVYMLTKSLESSLLWVGFAISCITIIVPLFANFWFFNTEYKKYLPSFRYVKMKYVRELMSLGAQFFVIQMASVVIFSSSNIIITQFYGPAEVTPFNIAFKYYGIVLSVFLLILAPFWSAYTDALIKGDMEWILRTNRKLKKFWLALVIVVILMTVVANRIYSIWIGNDVHVSYYLSASMALYVLIIAWSSIFSYFINGAGKIRLQLWASIGVSIMNIILALVFVKSFGLKSAGVILATCVVLLPWCFVWPIQMKKILSGTAQGIWTK